MFASINPTTGQCTVSFYKSQCSECPYYKQCHLFTPTTEVPICGHATIAAHYIYAKEHNLTGGRVIQKTKAGILPVAISSTGHSKIMVPIYSNEQLHALKPDMQKLTEISGKTGCNGYYVFTLNPQEEILVHGRMFAPAIGIAEDPVTGNANSPLGAYLVHFNIFQDKDSDCFEFDIL